MPHPTLHPTDELRLRAMLDHPHVADAIADMDDDAVEEAADSDDE